LPPTRNGSFYVREIWFWYLLTQLRGYEHIVCEDAHDTTDDGSNDWAQQPVNAAEQVFRAHQSAKQTRTKVTGRIDGITTRTAQRDTNRQHR